MSLQNLEEQVSALPGFRLVGALLLDSEQLNLSLAEECRLWKRAFGDALSRQEFANIADILSFVSSMTKTLQHPITDLEDVRQAMAAIKEVRVVLSLLIHFFQLSNSIFAFHFHV